MIDYVIMPKTDYQALCDTIRSKTGKTGPIKSGDLQTEILNMPSNGSSKEIHYITFMNGDTVLYKRPVADGDDCADVLERGLIETPTKESTVQYNYTFYGWGASDGGAADANILKNITEDKTVYAIFKKAAVPYTITWLDNDGTVLKVETLTYGAMPSYTPSKDGYSFVAWTPEVSSVVGDATYTASWEEFDDSLLPRQAFEFTKMNYDNFGTLHQVIVTCNTDEEPILVEGKTYIVEWDGVEYTCVGKMVTWKPYTNIPEVVVGNTGVVTKIAGTAVSPTVSATTEPFCIIKSTFPKIVLRTNTAGTHTVRIQTT